MNFDFGETNQKTNATGMVDWYGDTYLTTTTTINDDNWYNSTATYYADDLSSNSISSQLDSLAKSISSVSAMSSSLGSLSETLTNMTNKTVTAGTKSHAEGYAQNLKPKTLLEQVKERLEDMAKSNKKNNQE